MISDLLKPRLDAIEVERLRLQEKEEKEMVIKAMGFGAGHWYQCPNGHPYVIANCGGAISASRCP